MELLIVVGISCLLASPVLGEGELSYVQDNTIVPTEVSVLPCQPDSALNALLVQMLVALQPHLLLLQQQQQVHQWRTFGAQASISQPPKPTISTTLVTSTVVSTLTQRLSKIVSIWFRNERIPTTIFSQTTTVMTDYITITSTIGSSVEPTELLRKRRKSKDATLLESSISESGAPGNLETLPLSNDDTVIMKELSALLMQPKVAEAWSYFERILEEAHINKLNEKK